MAFTLEEYTILVAAIANGVLTVSYGDKSHTYRSLDEMLRIKGMMESELGIKQKKRVFYPNFKKGLEHREW